MVKNLRRGATRFTSAQEQMTKLRIQQAIKSDLELVINKQRLIEEVNNTMAANSFFTAKEKNHAADVKVTRKCPPPIQAWYAVLWATFAALVVQMV